MDSVWEKLSVPFLLRDLEWRVVRLSPDGMSAQVRPQLRLEVVRQRLTDACGEAGWSNSFSGLGEGAVACTLGAAGVHRSAVAARHPQRDIVGTSEDALVYAAEAFGVRAPISPAELPWVDYDPEHGNILFEPDLSDLGVNNLVNDPGLSNLGVNNPGVLQQGDPARPLYAPNEPNARGDEGADQGPASQASTSVEGQTVEGQIVEGRRVEANSSDPLPASPPAESAVQPDDPHALARPFSPTASTPTAPQSTGKPAGQRAIDRLLERLKAEGLGLQAARLVVEYGGYGSDPQAARELYAQLRGLLLTRPAEP